MWTRNLLKQNAKQVLRNNYWMAFLVAFVSGVIGANSSALAPSLNLNYSLDSGHYETGYFPGAGVMPYYGAILSAFVGFGLIVGVIAALIAVFLSNPISVGKCRYFMESRVGNSPFSTLFSTIGGPAYLNVVKVMFMKRLFIFLWSLLFVIPGIYKSYQYRMVDYLLAENPYMSYQRALELSKQMTEGEKFNIFVLEISFFGWFILGSLLCGIGTLFVHPYVEATFAELYAALRAKAFATGMTDASELGDFLRY